MRTVVEVFGEGLGLLVSESAHYATIEFDIEGHKHVMQVEAGEYRVLHYVGYEVL